MRRTGWWLVCFACMVDVCSRVWQVSVAYNRAKGLGVRHRRLQQPAKCREDDEPRPPAGLFVHASERRVPRPCG